MYKAVLFDLDGTLLDTIGDMTNAFNYTLEKRAYPTHDKHAYMSFLGNGKYVTLQRALGDKVDEVDLADLSADFDWYYSNHMFEGTMHFAEMPELLQWLKDEGVKISVVSNKDLKQAEKILDIFFAKNTFDFIIGASSEWPSKPDPFMALEAIKKFGLTVDECLFVGDTPVDIETAKNLGMDICAVSWGFREREQLEPHQPDYIVDTVEELKEVIKKG